jgi:thiamine pyrophosphate-dependent acetolactate synthase large subunit-like protein
VLLAIGGLRAARSSRTLAGPVRAQVEAMRQRVPRTKGAAGGSLTALTGPELDWVALAAGMGVPGVRARTRGELEDALRAALQRQGPFLIQACLA